MKDTKTTVFFAGILLTLLLLACQNPATVAPSGQEEAPASRADMRPFSASIVIGGGGSGPGKSRAIKGPNKDDIKDIYNYAQVIVMDDADKEIVDFAESLEAQTQLLGGGDSADFYVNIPSFGKKYHFLMLLGYLEPEATQPTLLAVGYKGSVVNGPEIVTIILWPLVVDTQFISANIASAEFPLSLLPVAWKVQWTMGTSDSHSGFEELRLAHTQTGIGGAFQFKALNAVGSAAGSSPVWVTVENDNQFVLDIQQTTLGVNAINRTAEINFNLEYVPFYTIVPPTEWAFVRDDSLFDRTGNPFPVWIIRNGLNDLSQDADTGIGNWNGAIPFEVKEAKSDKLVLKEGALGSAQGVQFTTAGYEGGADVYYAVVTKNSEPDYSDYVKLAGTYNTGHHDNVSVVFSTGQDVYLVLIKDGYITDPLRISSEGSVGIGIGWPQPPS